MLAQLSKRRDAPWRVFTEIIGKQNFLIRAVLTVNLVIRQLKKRFGEISQELQTKIANLPLAVVEGLSEALLDFTSVADLQAWLEAR